MKEDVTKRYSLEFALDLPIGIDGIVIYPILLKDMMAYYTACSVIKFEKAQVDVKYIKMSYYSFLCHYITSLAHSSIEEDRLKSNNLIVLFSSLFSLAMRKEILASFLYKEETKEAEIKLYELDIEKLDGNKNPYEQAKNTYILTKERFEDIRNILIKQNDIHYIDYNNYSRDMQELIKNEEKRRAGKSNMTLEDKIDSVIAATGWTTEDVGKLTIRRFDRIFERVRKKLEYQIYKTGAMSGLVSFKDKSVLEPWTTSLSFDPLKDIISDYGEVMDSMKHGMGRV